MIRSMTGFGRAENSRGQWRCGVELRSVNGRFLEIRFKLPPGLNEAEEKLKALVKARCERGKVDGTITLTAQNPEAAALALNRPLAAQYARLLKDLSSELGTEIHVSLGNLTTIKDLILSDQWGQDNTQIVALIEQVLGEALDGLMAMREREGAALGEDMAGRLDAIRATMSEIIPLVKAVPEQYMLRLRENLARLMEPGNPNEERICQEIAILAERCDVSEEISRIEAHLQHLEQMLSKGGALGRKCDFLLQEINREANTLASKSNTVPVSTRVVEIKSELEKLREQIQNIE